MKAAAEGEERGFPGGKKVRGRSRQVAVDSQGTLLAGQPRKKRLLARGLPLAGRTHRRGVGPGPPALQGVRKDRGLLRGVARVRDDAPACTPLGLFTTQVLTDYIAAQKIFFTATAPDAGRINLSPKGMDCFRCLDTLTVAYLDLTLT